MDPFYLRLIEQNFFEAQFAFEGLAPENVWKRPAAAVLSIGEIAGHVAYWEVARLMGKADGIEGCDISSPLLDTRFRYHTSAIAQEPVVLPMKAEEVWSEMRRVHDVALADFLSRNVDLDSREPDWPGDFTYRASPEYFIFHVAYHVGQMYTVRHLLGEKTPDN